MAKSWNINLKTLKSDVDKMETHIKNLEDANNRLDQQLWNLYPYLQTPDAKDKVYKKYGNYIANNQKWLAAFKEFNSRVKNTHIIKKS